MNATGQVQKQPEEFSYFCNIATFYQNVVLCVLWYFLAKEEKLDEKTLNDELFHMLGARSNNVRKFVSENVVFVPSSYFSFFK